MAKEEEGYKFPSRFYILVRRNKKNELLGTQSLQGFTEQSVERFLAIAKNMDGVTKAEIIEAQSLFGEQ